MELISDKAPKSLTSVSSLFIYLAFGLTSSFTSKNAWALSREFKLAPFSSCGIRNEWRQLHSVLFISVEYFCHTKWILSRILLWNSHIKIINLSLDLKVSLWNEWYKKWIITQGVGTPCLIRMLTTVFLSYLKANFRLKCVQTNLTCISLFQNVFIPRFLFPNWDWW